MNLYILCFTQQLNNKLDYFYEKKDYTVFYEKQELFITLKLIFNVYLTLMIFKFLLIKKIETLKL